MDEKIKKKWVKALKSGKYAQGRTALRGPEGYCCLGVLCDVFDPRGWASASSPSDNYIYEDEASNVSVPWRLMKQIGLSVEDSDELVHLNDFAKASFEKIADYIEEHL